FAASFASDRSSTSKGSRTDFPPSGADKMEDGRRQMVGLLLPSDFAGRPGRATSAYDVTAATDLVMCCFRRKPFESLMLSTPHIGQR
ncbi:cyclic nucleotide-binding domain-containing protein, partial [Ralstonia pseudosolanacearum]|uniref:cyclic nucleotide-binding domain-containing protein n=1 Tax=Ralstonia pseudosolanacearum TaxID=1310165 RepID=UPI003CF92EEF